MTDQTALQRYADLADAEAFRHLVHVHQGLVYAACQRRLGRAEDVEDAVQQTFIKLARHAGTIRGDVAAWLHRCAVNVSIDLIRRDAASRRHEHAAAAMDARRRAAAAGAGDAPWSDVSEHIDQAVAELDEPLRAAIVGHFFEGRSQRELAERSGVSAAAMNRRIGKAIEALRRALRKHGVAAPAAALAAGLPAFLAQASAVPAALSAELVKVGLAGTAAPAAVAAGGAAVGVSLGAKLGLIGAAAVVLGAAAVTAVVLVQKPAPPAVPALAAAPVNFGTDYQIRLPNDVVFQIVGVAAYPYRPGDPVYRPNGRPFDTPPFESITPYGDRPPPAAEPKAQNAIIFTRSVAPRVYRTQFTPRPDGPRVGAENDLFVAELPGANRSRGDRYVYGQLIQFDTPQPSVTVTYSAAVGEGERLAVFTPHDTGDADGPYHLLPTRPATEEGDFYLDGPLIHYGGDRPNYRVFARLSDGRRIEAVTYSTPNEDQHEVLRARFTPAEFGGASIDQLELRAVPFETGVIEGVVLPGAEALPPLVRLAGTYGLADGQDAGFFPQPFPPARAAYVDDKYPHANGSDNVQSLGLWWDGRELASSYMRYPTATLRSVLDSGLRIPWHHVAGLDAIGWEPGVGDWVVREGLTTSEKLDALAEVIREQTGLEFRFTPAMEPLRCIVVRGELRAAPIYRDAPENKRFQTVFITTDPLSEQDVQDYLDGGHPGVWTNRWSYSEWGPMIRTPIILANADGSLDYDFDVYNRLLFLEDVRDMSPDDADFERRLAAILDNLETQVGGRWSIETHPFQVWRPRREP